MIQKTRFSFVMFFILSVLPFFIAPALAAEFSFVGITSNGVEFPIEISDTQNQSEASEYSVASNATSVLDGLGYTASIVVVEPDGTVIWGTGVSGTASSITPYTPTQSDSDFAAVVLDTDTTNTYAIPELFRSYTYDGNSLVDSTEIPQNILGYSDSVQLAGTNTISLQSDGIHVQGNEMRAIKLNHLQGTDLIYRATVPSGASVELVESPNDLYASSHDGTAFVLYSGNANGALSSTKILVTNGYFCSNQGALQSDSWPIPLLRYKDYSCGSQYWSYAYETTSASVTIPHDVFVKNPASAVSYSYGSSSLNYGWWEYQSSPGGAHTRSLGVTVTVTGDPSVSTTQSGAYTKIDRISKSFTYTMPFRPYSEIPVPVSAHYTIKEAQPYDLQLLSTSDTELLYTMPSNDLYLLVKPNGGEVVIKGETYNPVTVPSIEIGSLPENTPYRISKDGWVGASGVTSADGKITLYEDDVNFEGFADIGGLLHIP